MAAADEFCPRDHVCAELDTVLKFENSRDLRIQDSGITGLAYEESVTNTLDSLAAEKVKGMANFVKVITAGDLAPGNGMVVEIGGRPVALFNVGGQFYALDNICVHRGGPLGEGYVDSSNLTVQCPWHGWVYSLVNGVSPVNPMAKVERFEVKVEGDEVMVDVEG